MKRKKAVQKASPTRKTGAKSAPKKVTKPKRVRASTQEVIPRPPRKPRMTAEGRRIFALAEESFVREVLEPGPEIAARIAAMNKQNRPKSRPQGLRSIMPPRARA